MEQAYSENLVGPDGRIARFSVHHVIEAAGGLVPKQAVETLPGAIGQLFIMRIARQFLHGTECVVPERLNLDRFSVPRRHNPVTHLGVHPGKLYSGLTGQQQAVVIHADAVPRATLMPRDNIREYARQSGLNEAGVSRMLDER